jgi:hypothetical protein
MKSMKQVLRMQSDRKAAQRLFFLAAKKSEHSTKNFLE